MSSVIEAKVSHLFRAPADKVFDAWLDPNMTAQWMFGPNIRDEEIVSIEINPEVGGEFSFLVKRNDLVVDHVGKYIKIEKPKELQFEWGVKGMKDNSKVLIKIEAHDAGCKLSLTHELDPAWKDYLQRCKDGWTEMLIVLEKALQQKAK